MERWLARAIGGESDVNTLLRAMLRGDVVQLQHSLQRLVVTALSFQDTAGRDPERVYHAANLGLLVHLRTTHRVESNRSTPAGSGFGRADVLITPRKKGGAGAVLEFKRLKPSETPASALDSAMAQIRSRAYAAAVRDAGASSVWCYAVLFDGKEVQVRAELG